MPLKEGSSSLEWRELLIYKVYNDIISYFVCEVERVKLERWNNVEIKVFSFLVMDHLSWDKLKGK